LSPHGTKKPIIIFTAVEGLKSTMWAPLTLTLSRRERGMDGHRRERGMDGDRVDFANP